MVRMTGFVRRGFCLAAIVGLLIATGAGAESKYRIKNAAVTGMGKYMVYNEIGLPINSILGVSMESALDAIREESKGSAVEINFGDRNGGELFVEKNIVIECQDGVVPDWGDITVSGSVRAEKENDLGVIRLMGGTGSKPLNVTLASGTKVTSTGNISHAVRVENNVALKMVACTLSTTGTGSAVYRATDNKAEIEIIGGNFTSKKGTAIEVTCPIKIIGGEFEAGGWEVIKVYDKLTVNGGTFKSTSSNGSAVYALGDLDLTDGWFESSNVAVYSKGACKIVGGELKSSSNYAVYALGDLDLTNGLYESSNSAVYSNGACKIVGGKFKSGSDYAVYALSDVNVSDAMIESKGGGVYTEGACEIVGGKFNCGSYYAVYALGEVNVNGGVFESKGGGVYSGGACKLVKGEFDGGSVNAVYARGNLNVNGGRFESSKTAVYSMGDLKIAGGIFKSDTGYAVYAAKGFVVDSGRFESSKTAFYSIGDGRITNGEFKGGSGNAIYIVGSINVYGGLFESRNTAVYSEGTMKIDGGGFKGGSGYAVYTDGDLDVFDGEFESSSTAVMSNGNLNILYGKFKSGSAYAVYAHGNLYLRDGWFESRNTAVYSQGTMKIGGGVFKSDTGYAVYALSDLEVRDGMFESSRTAIYSMADCKIDKGDFNGGSDHAVYVLGDLDVSGGKFVSSNNAVYSGKKFKIRGGVFEGGSGYALRVSGDGEINGGRFETRKGGTVLEIKGSNVLISGKAEFINRSSDNATIMIYYSGNVLLAEASVHNTDPYGRAISVTSESGRLKLSGWVSPYIVGSIASQFAGTIIVDSNFKPDKKTYILEPFLGACVDSAVAVVGGGKYITNFEYSKNGNQYHDLSTQKNDIIVVLKGGVVAPNYAVTGDTAKGFVASFEPETKNKVIGKSKTIAMVLDSIRIDADGRPCNIKFGDGESVLHAGRVSKHGIEFISDVVGAGWERVTLSGKLSLTRDAGREERYSIYVGGGMSVESSMDNPSTMGYGGSVYVGVGSRFIHNGGILCDGIHNVGGKVTVKGGNVPYINNENGGSLRIAGGIIGSDTLRGYAVKNDKNGEVFISDSAKIVSADTSKDGGTIINNGFLEMYDGLILNADSSIGSAYIAVNMEGMPIGANDSAGYGTSGGLVLDGTPIIDGIISLPKGGNSIIRVKADNGYSFDPKYETYSIVGSFNDGGVVVENGAGFMSSFEVDITDNAGLKIAVNNNNVVAAKNVCNVAFSLNGSLSNTPPPDTIKVIKGGRIGDLAKPKVSMENYVSKDGYKNDGKWYVSTETSNDGDKMNVPFKFNKDGDGTIVKKDEVLTLFWTNEKAISVLESTRDIPVARPPESAAIVPVVSSSGSLTAGPSPVSKSSGSVSFFRSGAALKNGKLFIYDASGKIITTLIVNDPSGGANRRPVAKWNLQDAKNRKVAEGTYVARGVITTKAGKTERVSVLLNVRE